ncbi:carboxy terminal-processing peptidase [Coraliomargarita sp. SDUM461004]|uniref:Carboxy terminal-processing peptidase n=1 Tax=Thalassobacterium sedimentorum TaxID=3041258 RepID=A0ABU1AP62_9BACT|nr:carboxy terminal-processing peptidase [Coraliomargarita sp. SDUM461004]MDQ8195561.1 carboxy terminal-processing peptidase [Coraliomargarita sp. SDUM461004]
MSDDTTKSRMNKRIFRFALAATAVLAFALSTYAKLEPSKEMASQTRWVVNTINARHYLRGTMEQLDGAEMVEAYIESFDYSRMYFLRPEVDDFIFRFGDAMEESLKKGNLYAAFDIYENFKQKAETRTQWAFERLEQDFDFSIEESFTPDRREAEWPATPEEAEALWLRRLKYELLNEMLSLAAEDKDSNSASLSADNPDVVDPNEDEEEFDPSKLLRLLEDREFYAETLDAAREKIHRRYERNLSHTIAREAAEVQESFINAMTQLFDPHSTFLSSDTLESFNSAVQNSFVGIGAMLEDDDGICTIKEILPGGPAERSRLLEAEDQILGVAQGDEEFEDVVDMQLRYIVRKIKGEKGTTVRLLIRPGDAADPSVRKIVPIVRDEVKLTANLATGKLISVPVNDEQTIAVGVIELPSFYGNIGAGGTLTTTTDDVSELINKLRDAGAEGLILDLRMNGGGLLSEAVRLTGLFIPVGPVVQVRDSSGRTDVLSDRDPNMLWDGPLIVLTSRFSASASEIVAGALQDNDRALIVGNSSTHGKGTVQEVYHMNSRMPFSFLKSIEPTARPVASKITIKQFFLPDGSSTQVKGVPSDIVLPSVNEFLPIGEDDLPHALPWDEVNPVDWINNWTKLDVDSPEDPKLVQRLIAASQTRQESLEEFQFLNKQIEWRRQRYEEKAISINLHQRIERKIREKGYIDELDEIYETLSENDYEIEEFLLKITEEQDALSKQTLAQPIHEIAEELSEGVVDTEVSDAIATIEGSDTAENEEEDDEATSYDIYLRESARIMADWIKALNKPKTATASTQVEAIAQP